jgi:acyl dehydratase
MSMQKGD